MDKVIKLETYKRVGVREYWIVDPEACSVEAYILEGGRYYTPDRLRRRSAGRQRQRQLTYY
jgi:Uma2 family endonuclease